MTSTLFMKVHFFAKPTFLLISKAIWFYFIYFKVNKIRKNDTKLLLTREYWWFIDFDLHISNFEHSLHTLTAIWLFFLYVCCEYYFGTIRCNIVAYILGYTFIPFHPYSYAYLSFKLIISAIKSFSSLWFKQFIMFFFFLMFVLIWFSICFFNIFLSSGYLSMIYLYIPYCLWGGLKGYILFVHKNIEVSKYSFYFGFVPSCIHHSYFITEKKRKSVR